MEPLEFKIKSSKERRLEREGLVEGVRVSRTRWHATTRAIALHGFAEGLQLKLEHFL